MANRLRSRIHRPRRPGRPLHDAPRRGSVHKKPHPFGSDTIKRGTPSGDVELSASHASFAVALMSSRVFSTAAAAQVSAHDRIDATLRNMPDIRRILVEQGRPVNKRLLDELQNAYMRGQIVLRDLHCGLSPAYRRWHRRRRPQGCSAGSPPSSLHLDHRDRHHRIIQQLLGRHAPNLRTYHHRRDLHRQRRRRPPGAPPSRSPLHQGRQRASA